HTFANDPNTRYVIFVPHRSNLTVLTLPMGNAARSLSTLLGWTTLSHEATSFRRGGVIHCLQIIGSSSAVRVIRPFARSSNPGGSIKRLTCSLELETVVFTE
ncbi:hypothetical protein, partial [Novipirellula artificiosorum]|uniref:hypothetical protein n=1 Tax=Novipirellula artificiosorum TaxID=2528016 RepID=UPI001E589F92